MFNKESILNWLLLANVDQIDTLLQSMGAIAHEQKTGDSETSNVRYRYSSSPDSRYWLLKSNTHVNGLTLGVAHADVVRQESCLPTWIKDKGGNTIVYHPNHDDRLGIFTLLVLLPLALANAESWDTFDVTRSYAITFPLIPESLKRPYDVLICTGEESGSSSAGYFASAPERPYNWLFEFDRARDDVVFYDYDDKRWRKVWIKYGFKAGRGSYSDIADLAYEGVKAANVGVGYSGQHTLASKADLAITCSQVSKFVDLWSGEHNKRYKHDQARILKMRRSDAAAKANNGNSAGRWDYNRKINNLAARARGKGKDYESQVWSTCPKCNELGWCNYRWDNETMVITTCGWCNMLQVLTVGQGYKCEDCGNWSSLDDDGLCPDCAARWDKLSPKDHDLTVTGICPICEDYLKLTASGICETCDSLTDGGSR